MNHAAKVVLLVVSAVVIAYCTADVWIAIQKGELPESSRQMFAGSVGALIAFIAQTGKKDPPHD